MPTFFDGLRAALITDAVLTSAREERWVDVAASRERAVDVKLGFLTSCMPERSLEDIAAWAGAHGYEALELAAWPHLGDRPFTASHVKADAFDDAEAERVRRALERQRARPLRAAYYDNNLAADAEEREAYHAHLRACIDAAAALGGVPVGTFIGRDPGRSVAENLREAERVFPPLVDYAGERGVRLMIENCVMEGWHPDGYPGNLAYSPELWEWMFELGLYLNFDPSHLLWLGIDPVDALRPYVDRVAHAHAKDAETFPGERNRYGFFGRHRDSRGRPVGHGLVALSHPRSGTGRLPPVRRHALRGRVRRRPVGRARGPGLGRDARVDRGRPRDRPQQPPRTGGPVTKVLEVRNLVKEFPGVKALQGVDLDVLEAEVHCLLGPNGAGKSTLIKCVSGAVEPTSGEILFLGEPLPTGDPAGSLKRGVATIYQELDLVADLSVAESIFLAHEPRRWPLLDLDKMYRDSAALLARLGHESIPVRAKVGPLATGCAAGRLDRPRAVGQRAAADHGRAVGDPRRGRDRDALRRGSPAHRGGCRGRLHLASPRRDPAHRRPRHRACGRPHDGHGLPATTPTDELVEFMVGRKVDQLYPERPVGTDRVLLEVRDARRLPAVRGVSLQVHAGEVVGLGGLVGSGRTELLRLIYGLDQPDAGEVLIEGKQLRPSVRATRSGEDSGSLPRTASRRRSSSTGARRRT